MEDGATQLQKQLVDYIKSLFHEGFLDKQYFTQLQQLQDEASPDFVVEVINLYFDDTERLISEMASTLNRQNVDFRKLDTLVHQLKGSSSSIGCNKVHNECIAFRNCCEETNVEGCLEHLQQVRHEYSIIKNKLETLMKLEKQLLEAGGSIPMYLRI